MLALALSGCQGTLQRSISQLTPAVQAANGGMAELIVEACPIPPTLKEVEATMVHILSVLQSTDILVTADGATSKLTIDLCHR